MTVAVRDADKARELGPCAVVRTDEFTGTMSNGVASFAGTLRYSYQVAPGADCRDIVGSSGEPANPNLPHFATLPCDLRLAVTATRTGDPK
jgi:hypothetical protein